MVKLTNDARDQIRFKMLDHKFEPIIAELAKERAELAKLVYCEHFTPTTRQKMEALPKGWLPTKVSIDVTFGDRSPRTLYFSGRGSYGVFGAATVRSMTDKSMRFLQNAISRHVALDATSSIGVRLEKSAQAVSKFETDWKEVDTAIKVALAQYSTYEKLKEGWPEAEPFLKGIAPAKVTAVATVPAKLNEMLGLPVETNGS